MTTAAARFRDSRARLIGHFGGDQTLTLRRFSTIRLDETGGLISTLSSTSAASAGETSLSVSSGSAIRGALVHGSQFTILGHSAPYTLTADVEVPHGAAGSQVLELTFTPALESNVGKFEALTIASRYGDQDYSFQEATAESSASSLHVEGAERTLWVAAAAGARAPETGDVVQAGGLPTERVVHVETQEPEKGLVVGWTVYLSSRAR